MTEKDVMKGISKRLGVYEFDKSVIWWTRLNSGKVRTEFGSWIQMCPKGTPDFIALLRNKQNGVTVLFIEAKSDTGKLSQEQIVFANKYKDSKDVYVLEIDDPEMVDEFIFQICLDQTDQIDFNIA